MTIEDELVIAEKLEANALKMRFVSTVDFDFGKQPALRMLTVHRWLRALGVRDEQVYGIMSIAQAETRIVRLKFKEESDYRAFFDKYAGVLGMSTEEETVFHVTVREAGTRDTFVRLIDVPFEMPGDAIKAALQPYGAVLSLRREKYMGSAENDYFQVLTGTVTAKMSLNRHVPSYLRVAEQRIIAKYPGQPATCMICNQPGHMAVNCPAKKTGQRFVGRWAETPAVVAQASEEADKEPHGENSNQ